MLLSKMAAEGGGKEMNEIKTQFTTREGLYKLLSHSEYSRPNRVPFNSQGSNPVRVSFVNVNDQSGNGDRLCFNVGRELYFYIYKGVRKVPGLGRRAGGLGASAPPAEGPPAKGRGAASWAGGGGTAGLTAAGPGSAAREGALGREGGVWEPAPAPSRGSVAFGVAPVGAWGGGEGCDRSGLPRCAGMGAGFSVAREPRASFAHCFGSEVGGRQCRA